MSSADHLNTQNLVQAAQRGDVRALDDLFARHLPVVRQVVALRLGRRLRQLVDLEDIVQGAVVRALEGMKTFEHRSEGSFRHWLAACVEQEIIRHSRREGAQKRGGGKVRRFRDYSTTLLQTSVLPGKEPTPSHLAAARETEERIEAALLELPVHHRELIILRRLCGLSYAEVAQAMGFEQEGTARVAISRALAKLRGLLEAPDGPPAPGV
jgi:RNA polymerase sigma-70 factor (subfamily 1)